MPLSVILGKRGEPKPAPNQGYGSSAAVPVEELTPLVVAEPVVA